MVEGTVIDADPAKRFIIERPRLTRLLDETDARIILLLAPAGYGKTTLARQWLASRRGTWYRGPRATNDLASFAVGIGRAVTEIQPGADARLLSHVRAASTPEAAVEALAETLAAEITDWPDDAWLVIDEYEAVADFSAANRFIEILADATPIRLLVTTRNRPQWIPSRRVLYGEVFEFRVADLALTEDEARDVLAQLPSDGIERVIAAARGWPAVTRLAAISGSFDVDAGSLPEALHDYIAEELYAAAEDTVRQGLLALAALPTLSAALSEALLGDRADDVRAAGVELGFLTPGAENALELHPLLRTFLQAKLRESPESRRLARDAAEAAIGAAMWSHAFAAIQQFTLDDLLPRLFAAALDEMLSSNYTATLQGWVTYAAERRCDFPLLDLADAELRRRRGDGAGSEAHALQAARRLEVERPAEASRAYAIAGAAAHRDMRLSEAQAYFRRATDLAVDREQQRRALWGEFIVAWQLESAQARELLEGFDRLTDGTPSQALRAAAGRLMLVTLEDSIDVAVERDSRLLSLVDRADDPFATSQFLYRIGYMHVLAARYEEGAKILVRAAADAQAAGLAFVLPHVAGGIAAAAIGLRHLKRAAIQVSNLEEEVHRTGDEYEIANTRALRARIQLQSGDAHSALDGLRDWRKIEDVGFRYECGALAALALALSNNHREAAALASETIGSTRAAQPLTIAHIVRAISSLLRSDNAGSTLTALEDVLASRCDWDSLVLGYRCHPPLLGRLYERAQLDRARLEQVVREARDLRLAAAIGWRLPKPTRRAFPLTPREREVVDLLAQGLSNKEIAAKLVIEVVTVKVHVRHILEKLGARSRTEAVAMLHDDA